MHNNIYYLTAPKIFQKKVVELKELKENFIRVRNLYCGVCGSDISHYKGFKNKFPISLGHEFISEVVEINTTDTNLQKGDFVVSDFNFRCGQCEFCITGRSHLCVKNDIQLFSNRAFANYSDIHYSYLFKANDLVTIQSGTLIEPLSCVLHAMDCIDFLANYQILLVGCGNIGSLISFFLYVRGFQESVTIHDRVENKIDTLKYLFGFKPANIESRQFDIVIDASNHISGLEYAASVCKKGGLLCSISHHFGSNISKVYESVIKNEIHLKFPLRNGQPSNMEKGYEMVRDNWKTDYESIYSVHELYDIENTFRNKETFKNNKIIVSI